MSKKRQLGELSELEFILAAAKQGITACKPYGDDKRYDFITEKNSLLKRVQVKSVNPTYRKDKQCWKYQITFNGKNYKNDVEVLAIYLIDRDSWYLIPSSKVRANYSIDIGTTKRSLYSRYLNNWKILGGKDA
jgi:hypothetical protein